MKGVYVFITICLVVVLLSKSALYYKIGITLLYLFGIYFYFYRREKK